MILLPSTIALLDYITLHWLYTGFYFPWDPPFEVVKAHYWVVFLNTELASTMYNMPSSKTHTHTKKNEHIKQLTAA